MAATLFAEPPSATLEEAVQHFLNGKLYLDFNFKPTQLKLKTKQVRINLALDVLLKFLGARNQLPIRFGTAQKYNIKG